VLFVFGGENVAALRVIVTILYVLLCVALVIVVMLQESRTQGLSGTVNGMAETYWGRNKGRSMEGRLEMITRILTCAFICLSIVLNLKW
jgi:preprotein translocase subunit SecG